MTPGKRPKSFALNLLFFVLLGLLFVLMWRNEILFDSGSEEVIDQAVREKVGPLHSLHPILIELSGRYLDVIPQPDGKAPKLGTKKRYLGLTIDLELKKEQTVELVRKHQDQITGVLSAVASGKRVKDIETTEGKQMLADEIREKLNQVLPEPCVARIHFKDFVIK